MNNLKRFAPALIVGTALLWSLDSFIRASSLYALPPILISFWEHFLGLFLITPLFWANRHEIATLSRKEWYAILIIGFVAGPIAGILYTYALTQVGFANFSVVLLLQQTQPIWAILVAGLLLKEKVTKTFVMWAGAAMIGVYLIVFKDLVPNLETGAGTMLAGVLALLAATAWGSATSFGKFVLNKVSFSTIAFLRFSLATVFSFILFFAFATYQLITGVPDIFGKSHTFTQFTALTPDQWLNLIMIVCISGASAMLLYYYGLKHTPARVATICELTWPASALIIGIVFFKNTFTATQIVGIILLVVSMYIISSTQRDAQDLLPEKQI
jgi:drug/metabolite transporter (DMT)-like permease